MLDFLFLLVFHLLVYRSLPEEKILTPVAVLIVWYESTKMNCNIRKGYEAMLRGFNALIILLIITPLLTGCEEKIIYKKNLTLVDYEQMENNRYFIIATFEDKKGNKHRYTMHEKYTNLLEKGEEYDIGYAKKSLFRPDNEIIRLNPFKNKNYFNN